MKTLEAHKVDLWDGGERHNFGFYLSKDVTVEEIKANDPHCYVSSVTLTVFDSLQEVADNTVEKLRYSAWLKLSPQERQALGLTEPKKPA
ncbi:hypothetical protein D9M72_200170 [compost metagenome]